MSSQNCARLFKCYAKFIVNGAEKSICVCVCASVFACTVHVMIIAVQHYIYRVQKRTVLLTFIVTNVKRCKKHVVFFTTYFMYLIIAIVSLLISISLVISQHIFFYLVEL